MVARIKWTGSNESALLDFIGRGKSIGLMDGVFTIRGKVELVLSIGDTLVRDVDGLRVGDGNAD